MTKSKVSYQSEGKGWYVAVRSGSNYIRHDLTEHSHMMNGGGTYFETKEEAQAVCDAYNRKKDNKGIAIKEGRYYVTKDGTKVGPAKHLGELGSTSWDIPLEDGRFLGYNGDGEICIDWADMNIVEELDVPVEDIEVNTQEIKVGLTYQCNNEREFTCIYIEGDKAWMRGSEDSPAYVWNKDTGITISLDIDTGYNLKRSFVTV